MPDARARRPDDLFGTDGVRGIAGVELTPELATSVARAFASLLPEDTASPTVLMARDTRPSGPELAEAMRDELSRHGITVLDCGVLPTGGLCLLVRERGADGGVIISASHNPPESNGIKLIGRGGHKLPLDLQHRVEDLIRAQSEASPAHVATPAPFDDYPEASEDYLSIILDGLPPRCLDGLRVVLDCAHGSASRTAPVAFERAGANVSAINCDGDGARINVNCGSTHPGALARAVVMQGADLGVAFDGDADRAVLVSGAGEIVDGDASKYILAMDLRRKGLLKPPLVIGTVMNNFGLERALADAGIGLERTPVGDRHVVERMRETGARLGGEQSGHVIFQETLIGDGTYTALRICEVVTRTRRTLAELAQPVGKIPQHLVNIRTEKRERWRECQEVLDEIARWEHRLEGHGRILVRSSGTEPLVRVMVEAEDDEIAREAVHAVAVAIRVACAGAEA